MSAVSLDYDLHGPAGAPVIVLASSLGTTRHMWDGLLPALSARMRVVRFDTRGHGGSPVPAGPYAISDLGHDVLALLDTLRLPRVSFCGLSLGGMIGMWLAAHAPQRIDRLALYCTSAYLPPAQAWTGRAATVRAGGTADVAEAVAARWFTPEFRLADPQIAARYTAMLAATPAEGYAGCCEAIAAMDLRADLPRISAPTLVVAGDDDPATPIEHAKVIADAVPGARLARVPGAHLAAVEAPDAAATVLLEHLTR